MSVRETSNVTVLRRPSSATESSARFWMYSWFEKNGVVANGDVDSPACASTDCTAVARAAGSVIDVRRNWSTSR